MEFEADYKEARKLAEFIGIDDAAFPEWGLTIVGYMDDKGDSRFETRLWGAHQATTLIGILHVVQQELLSSFTAEEIEDEES